MLKDVHDVKFLLDRKLMIIQNEFEIIAELRRLSTESYITDPSSTLATQWVWYWNCEDGIFRLVSGMFNTVLLMHGNLSQESYFWPNSQTYHWHHLLSKSQRYLEIVPTLVVALRLFKLTLSEKSR